MNVQYIKEKYLSDKRQTGQLGITRTGKGYKMSSSSENAIASKKLSREKGNESSGYIKGSENLKNAEKAIRLLESAWGDLVTASNNDNGLSIAVSGIRKSIDTYKKLLRQKAKGSITV